MLQEEVKTVTKQVANYLKGKNQNQKSTPTLPHLSDARGQTQG